MSIKGGGFIHPLSFIINYIIRVIYLYYYLYILYIYYYLYYTKLIIRVIFIS